MVLLPKTRRDFSLQRTVVLLATQFPHPVATFLREHGYNVIEATSVDEVTRVAQDTDLDALIVAPGTEWVGLDELSQRRIMLNLTVHASGADVFFELSHLFPSDSLRLQI